MANQGIFQYPGITGVLSASVTISPGIVPSITTVELPTFPGNLPRTGEAKWLIDSTVIRSFPKSAIIDYRMSRPGGATVWQISIADRRWMWIGGQITGNYNEPNGNNVEPLRKKSPKELATLCLDAMNETGYDVSVLPEEPGNYVDWKLARPMDVLAEVCDQFSCEIHLTIDDKVAIKKKGDGEGMPTSNNQFPRLTYEEFLDPVESPKKYYVVSAPTEWQMDLLLEGVGYEKGEDAEPKLIDDLSYKPTDGWGEEGDDFDGVADKEERELAKQHVGRSFRINIDAIKGGTTPEEGDEAEDAGNENMPMALIELKELEQVLPILGRQVETIGKNREKRFKESIVWGSYAGDEPIGKPTAEYTDINDPKNFKQEHIYRGSFTIDEKRGVVNFSERVNTWENNPSDRVTKPPRLFLRCTVNLYDIDTRQVQRYERNADVDPTSEMLPFYEIREDVTLRIYQRLPDPEWKDNKDDVERRLDYYGRQALAKLVPKTAASATFGGFIGINTDGAIRQISYVIAADGEATSSVERHREDVSKTVTWEELRTKLRHRLLRKRAELMESGETPDARKLQEISDHLRRIGH